MKIGIVDCGMVGSTAAYALVLLHDQRAILTNCCRIAGVPLSLPHLVCGNGALAPIPLPIDAEEHAALRRSAGILREAIASLEEAQG